MKLFFRSLIFLFFFGSQAGAVSIIRDAEIENILRAISDPIFEAANLPPESIKIYIVNDSKINAYVSGGSNIFINTGLLSMSENPNMLTGVIAHETGHISGGHLLQNSDEFKNTSIKATLGYMVGLAAAAAGSPQAGIAIASGARHVADRQMLKYTRTKEESADQAALSYLDKTKQSAAGLLELLEVLYSKETSLYDDINPYTLTHPLSRERISHVQNHLATSKFSDKTIFRENQEAFTMAITKLNAFLNPYKDTLRKYPESDKSLNALYARAIAYYKMPDIESSLKEINALINLQPKNPFFYELKGQILFENGKVSESIPYYEKAIKLLPKSPLLKIILATAQISSEEEEFRSEAINNLEQALLKERGNTFAWRQLAIAYGRGGDLGMSNLALAEESLLTDNKKATREFLTLAKKHIKDGTPADLRAKDILSSLEED